jgi:hypothetical protein
VRNEERAWQDLLGRNNATQLQRLRAKSAQRQRISWTLCACASVELKAHCPTVPAAVQHRTDALKQHRKVARLNILFCLPAALELIVERHDTLRAVLLQRIEQQVKIRRTPPVNVASAESADTCLIGINFAWLHGGPLHRAPTESPQQSISSIRALTHRLREQNMVEANLSSRHIGRGRLDATSNLFSWIGTASASIVPFPAPSRLLRRRGFPARRAQAVKHKLYQTQILHPI